MPHYRWFGPIEDRGKCCTMRHSGFGSSRAVWGPMNENAKTGGDGARGKREAVRQRTLKGGTIVYGDGIFAAQCSVRDLSESGAKLKLTGSVTIPDTFVLTIEVDSVEYDCKVAWRTPDELGVEFTSPARHLKTVRQQSVSDGAPPPRPSLRRKP